MTSERVAGEQLRAFVERIERMDEEIKALNDDKKEIFAEAKGIGFDTKAMKIVLKHRRMDRSERFELEAIVELYEAALGMSTGDDEAEREAGTVVATRAPAPATQEFTEPARSPNHAADASEASRSDAGGIVPPGDAAPIQPETAAQTEGSGGPAAANAGLASVESPATVLRDRAEEARLAHNQEVGGSNPSPATSGEATSAATGESPVIPAPVDAGSNAGGSDVNPVAQAGEPDADTQAALPANVTRLRRQPKHTDPAHPDCLDPGQCGGFSNLGLCQRCKDAVANDREVGAA